MRVYGSKKNDANAWLTRTGSRSTVPSQRGHFRGLAPDVPDEMPFHERRAFLCSQLERYEAELQQVRRTRYKSLDEAEAERSRLVALLNETRRKLRELKTEARISNRMPESKAFQKCAMILLEPELYERILQAARRLMEPEGQGHKSENTSDEPQDDSAR